jgi:large subunit ribosomal protein L18
LIADFRLAFWRQSNRKLAIGDELKMGNRNRAEVRNAVHRRIRRKVVGTTERPRLAVYRSLNHIYAQVIDDEQARTIAAASTTEKTLGARTGGNIEAARLVGQAIAERALAAGISRVVFDRGGYLYHGRVRALTEAARSAGLNKDEVSETEAASAEETSPKEVSAGEARTKEVSAGEARTKEASAGEARTKQKRAKEKDTKETKAKEEQ